MKSVAAVKDYLDERNWNHLKPSDLAKSISIEAAELLELFQWHDYSIEEIKNNPELELKLKKELADVLIYCFELAVHFNYDVEELVLAKLAHNAKKYPAEEMREQINDNYYQKRKMAYRSKGK